jgi:hypothetical protein
VTNSTPPPGGNPYPGGTWSWSDRAPDQEPGPDPRPPLDPLSRRLLQAAGFLSVILVALVAYSIVSGGEDTNFNPIARAAERAERTPGMRMAIHGMATSESSSATVPMEGSGAYDGRTGRSSIRLTMEVPGRGSFAFYGVGVGKHAYMRSPLLSAGLPPGKKWMGIEAAAAASSSTELGGSGDMREELKMLQATSDNVEDLGEVEVQGVQTTAYRATVDYDRYASLRLEEGNAAGAREIEKVAALMGTGPQVTVWIDEHDLMRAMRFVMPIASAEGRSGGSVDMTTDFFDFGASPRVRLPDPGRVFDATAMGRAVLGLLDGSTVHFPSPAPDAPALSPSAYRERANSVCRQIEREAKRRGRGAEQASEALHELKESRGELAAVEALPAYMLKYVDPLVDWAHKAYGRFTRLPPPASLSAGVDRLNRLTAAQLEAADAYSQATELKDLKLAGKISPQRRALSTRVNRLARHLGLGECGKESGEGG